MSTRANILIKDGNDKQWFYRHSDGYPSSTAENLKIFIGWLNDGLIRRNVGQGASWLIILGNNDTNDMISRMRKEGSKSAKHENFGGGKHPYKGSGGWKVGSYEITTEQHGDIEYLYTIDMKKKTVKIQHLSWGTRGISNTYSYEEFLKEDFSE